jgi:Ni,Fe-hydrogenase III small subunit/NAD-dependent dihydropyrimidine dehydrogenase PreA subunit
MNDRFFARRTNLCMTSAFCCFAGRATEMSSWGGSSLHGPKFEMNLSLPKALAVRVAEGQPVIPDVMAASTPARFRGKLKIDATRCPDGCAVCVEVCPTQAISTNPLTIDLGSCVFCPLCVETCPEGAITYTNDYRMAATSRQGLRLGEVADVTPEACSEEIHRLFGRSLKLRSVSAGGCNGCELELNALGNVNFDMGRFGIEFVASPRHADGIVLSGTTTRNMEHALAATYEAVPAPKLVILFGACAISAGIFQGSDQLARKYLEKLKIDLYIPGCPPHPLTFIYGLLTYLRKTQTGSKAGKA